MNSKFINPELQKIDEQNKQYLEERIKKLNVISSDIKNLESLLKTKGCPPTGMEIMDPETSNKIHILWGAGRIWIKYDSEPARRFIETPASIRLKYSNLLGQFFENCVKVM